MRTPRTPRAPRPSPEPAGPAVVRDEERLRRPVFGRKQTVLTCLVVAACFLVIGGVGRFVVYPAVAGARHWRRAQEALAEDDFARARKHLERCLQVEPASAETQFLLARTCRRAGDFPAAQIHLRQARRLGWVPQLVELEALLIRAQAGMVRAVEPALRGYLGSGHRDRALILEALVRGCLQSNSLQEAYRWSGVWVEHDPADWRARFWAGQVLEAGVRYDLAAEEYQRSLAAKPDHAPTRLRLATVLLAKSRYAEALPHFEAYLEQRPHDADALAGLARCQRVVESPEAARATLDRLLAEYPEHAGGLLLRGQVALDESDPEAALGYLRRAERLAPHDLDTCQALATALRHVGRTAEAEAAERRREQVARDLKRLEELIKETVAHPQDVGLRYEAGTLLLRLGQEQQGIRWLAGALLLDPHHQPTRQALADWLAKSADPELAAMCRRLLEDTP